MRKFQLIALVDQDKLGATMAYMIDNKHTIVDCSIVASPTPVGQHPRTVPARPPRKKVKTWTAGVGSEAKKKVLELMPPAPATIQRKEVVHALQDKLSMSAVDGALSRLSAEGQLVRHELGTYSLPGEPNGALGG